MVRSSARLARFAKAGQTSMIILMLQALIHLRYVIIYYRGALIHSLAVIIGTPRTLIKHLAPLIERKNWLHAVAKLYLIEEKGGFVDEL